MMITTVAQRCHTIATFRHVTVRLMETLARWTPTTPEMEAKVTFGRHIWQLAQQADRLGKRTFELRQKEHYSLEPTPAWTALLDQVARETATGARLAGFYDGLLPGLITRCRSYLESTDPILDGPSVVIVKGMIQDLDGMRAEAAALQGELDLPAGAESLAARERAIPSLLAEGA
jgi:hypothetical protein